MAFYILTDPKEERTANKATNNIIYNIGQTYRIISSHMHIPVARPEGADYQKNIAFTFPLHNGSQLIA